MKRFLMLAALLGGLGVAGTTGTAEANHRYHGYRFGGTYYGTPAPFIGGGYYGGNFVGAAYPGLYRPFYVGTPGVQYGLGTSYVAPGFGYGYGYVGGYGW